ncbi:hypothetical protein CBOM_07592 [Ceraceosorus bombacis]|uniref:Uncharacterized protein n=1 Tax=Ceraceosorus bombacis TaxID=401625 RepID=A0A0P1BGR3_9BASI|nr:hypothetical protein CBOM_07592 [Ceraceosorus bombacis]
MILNGESNVPFEIIESRLKTVGELPLTPEEEQCMAVEAPRLFREMSRLMNGSAMVGIGSPLFASRRATCDPACDAELTGSPATLSTSRQKQTASDSTPADAKRTKAQP